MWCVCRGGCEKRVEIHSGSSAMSSTRRPRCQGGGGVTEGFANREEAAPRNIGRGLLTRRPAGDDQIAPAPTRRGEWVLRAWDQTALLIGFLLRCEKKLTRCTPKHAELRSSPSPNCCSLRSEPMSPQANLNPLLPVHPAGPHGGVLGQRANL